MKPTYEELLEKLRYWQKRLLLCDWNIELKYPTFAQDMPIKDTFGTVNYSESTKHAKVFILDPDHYKEGPWNIGKTILHELLHLKMCLLDESGNTLQDRIVHQLVDDLAWAFANAERGGTLGE